MNHKLTATVFDIQKCSCIDGPGIRTTVFFKGCNLRCRWCHNPESQKAEREMMFRKNRCTGCGKCLTLCRFDLKNCDLCGACTVYCPANAREIVGKEYSLEEMLQEVAADKLFYQTSNGGVTFSGGECMLRVDFLSEILRMCKEEGIHTAVDTAGCVPWESFEKVLPFSDMFLYDLKAFSDGLHREGTGASNRVILSNLQRLSSETACEIIVRIPVIPDYNANMEELSRMAEFLAPLRLRAVELLPYHRMGDHKYEALGRVPTKYTVPSEEEMESYRALFRF